MDTSEISKIEAFIKEKGIKRGGVVMFEPEDGLHLIDLLFEFSVPVLGIDGFFITDSTVQPSFEDMLDASLKSKGRPDMSETEMKDSLKNFVLERKDKGLHFEVVF